MGLLQDEAELDEIVKMVGMDALSPSDRLKMEAARSIREDFLHQNSFHEIDTYSSLKKQYLMMKLVLAFYEESSRALSEGASMNKLIGMPVPRADRDVLNILTKMSWMMLIRKVTEELTAEVADTFGKEDF